MPSLVALSLALALKAAVSSAAVALLLAENPELSSHTAAVIEDLLPGVMALLNGERAKISRKLRRDIGTLLGEFEADASPNLKTTIRKVKREIKKGTMFRKLGMAVR